VYIDEKALRSTPSYRQLTRLLLYNLARILVRDKAIVGKFCGDICNSDTVNTDRWSWMTEPVSEPGAEVAPKLRRRLMSYLTVAVVVELSRPSLPAVPLS
jgi:hypothetical protein